MKQEISCGIIPVKQEGNHWLVLLIRLHAGHWGFPKGRMEKEETFYQTACRELKEETGLTVEKLLHQEPWEETYFFHRKGELVKKRALYFLASVAGQEKAQEEEVAALQWIDMDKAADRLTFSASKAICQKAQEILC